MQLLSVCAKKHLLFWEADYNIGLGAKKEPELFFHPESFFAESCEAISGCRTLMDSSYPGELLFHFVRRITAVTAASVLRRCVKEERGHKGQ